MAAAASPLGPLFSVAASRVRPLASPPAFAAALLAGVRASQRRATLAALYLGSGAPERRLVRALRLQCARRPRLHVAVQLDLRRALRASAPGGAFASPAHHLLELFRPFDARDADADAVAEADADAADGLDAAGDGRSGSGSGSGSSSGGAPLSSRVHVGLTLLPQQRVFPASSVPPRWVESAGVFHAKAFVFDRHTVLLSGANLSEEYFTTRQDRYVLVGGDGGGDGGGVGALADYLHGLVDDLRTLPGAHTLRPDGAVAVNSPRRPPPAPLLPRRREGAPPPQLQPTPAAPSLARPATGPAALLVAAAPAAPLNAAFAEGLRRVLDARSFRGPPLDPGVAAEGMCLIAPRLQLGLLGVRHDERATLALLRGVRDWPRQECHVATGYFNITRDYADAIIGPAGSGSRVRMLTAAPAANGFFGARGISGAVPAAYAELARRFFEACAARGRLAAAGGNGAADSGGGGGGGGGGGSGGSGGGVSLHEYERAGWTFHAKGLWLTSRAASEESGGSGGGTSGDGSVVSLVGSPNFGRRSTERDLELQFAFSTRDAGLVARLRGEREALWSSAHVAEVRRDTWQRDDRRIEGAGWRRGRWIHAFLAVFAALF